VFTVVPDFLSPSSNYIFPDARLDILVTTAKCLLEKFRRNLRWVAEVSFT